MKKLCLIMAAIMINFLAQGDVKSQTRKRSEIPVEHTWNLADLYPSVEAWEEAKNEMVKQFDEILQFKGKLTSSASQCLACLQLDSEISKTFSKLYSYAGMNSDQDTRVAANMGLRQELGQLVTDYSSKTSFMEPELVKLDKETIDQFIKEEPELEVYRFALYDLQRRKEHMLSEPEEKIIAQAGLMAGGASSIYSIFSNAELPYPEAQLTDGTKIKLDQAGYSRYRTLPNREDREIVFKEFWNGMNKFRQTFGAQLYANVKQDMFYARVRDYENSLQSSLDRNNIPIEVYHALIKNVNDNLDSFHRYLNIKKRMLKVDTLKYSDLYAPTVKGVDLEYSIEDGKKLVLASSKIMGNKYLDVVKRAFNNRWIDIFPTEGKRSGAYSNGSAYDVHPYILLNYNGKYGDVSTLAHELGHTMHSYYSNKNQPYPLADYSIFVAEVASTFNEALLKDHVLKQIKDDDVRLSLLMEYLDGLKGTVFRQTQFAEYELKIHEVAESGKPLTGDVLTELYAEILKKYYGHDKGVCHIEDMVTVEWSYIPHFYYNFYVYQYATSFCASTALAERVLNKEEGAVDNMLTFLSAGGSDYPIEILKKAGVDMTTSDPFDKTMSAMNRTMDEIEKILDKKGL